MLTFSRKRPVYEVIKDVRNIEPHATVEDLAKHRGTKFPILYPKLLMACEGDQVEFLLNLYDHFQPDDDIKIMWLGVIKAGLLPQLLDSTTVKASDLIYALQYVSQATRAKEKNSDHVCQRCRRLRR